jgi:hypothetical protein
MEDLPESANAAMRALYRELDEQGLPGDPAFDVEAGLRDLRERLARDAAAFKDEPAPAHITIPPDEADAGDFEASCAADEQVPEWLMEDLRGAGAG